MDVSQMSSTNSIRKSAIDSCILSAGPGARQGVLLRRNQVERRPSKERSSRMRSKMVLMLSRTSAGSEGANSHPDDRSANVDPTLIQRYVCMQVCMYARVRARTLARRRMYRQGVKGTMVHLLWQGSRPAARARSSCCARKCSRSTWCIEIAVRCPSASTSSFSSKPSGPM